MENLERLSDRELDAMVAEKVMGWKDLNSNFGCSPGEMSHEFIPDYSTDIAAAWTVVEKLQEQGWLFCLDNDISKTLWGVWLQYGQDGEEFEIHSDTAPRAICLAALKAMESK